MNPYISIIVPVYNAEETIHRCIDSIINQTYTVWELLLINDGSRDNSGIICDKYLFKDSRIKVFHKKNGGVSSARNLGLNQAKGDWITFVDSDDYVNENWLSLFVNNLYSSIDLIVQGYNNIVDYNIKNSEGIDYNGNVSDGFEKMYANSLKGYVWNKLFSNYIITYYHIRFCENFKFREDEEFVLRYLLHCDKIISIKEGGYNYNVPDYNKKYKEDNFYTILSCFHSVNNLLISKKGKIYESYLQELTNSFFSSFTYFRNSVTDKRERVNLFYNEVGKNIFRVKKISFFSKIMFLLPSNFSYYIFNLKGLIFNKYMIKD